MSAGGGRKPKMRIFIAAFLTLFAMSEVCAQETGGVTPLRGSTRGDRASSGSISSRGTPQGLGSVTPVFPSNLGRTGLVEPANEDQSLASRVIASYRDRNLRDSQWKH